MDLSNLHERWVANEPSWRSDKMLTLDAFFSDVDALVEHWMEECIPYGEALASSETHLRVFTSDEMRFLVDKSFELAP